MSEQPLHDVLVIGAGPTGLACAIAAQRAGCSVILVDKGCLTNSLFHYPAHMTFFTTPELLEIGNMPFSSPNQKPTRAEALEYYRKVSQHYNSSTSASTRTSTRHLRLRRQLHRPHHRQVRPQAHPPRPQARRLHRLLRSAQLPRHPRRRPAQDQALLSRAPPLLRPGRPCHRRKELRRYRRARSLASRRARHAGPSRPGASSPHQVLDQARHRKPHQERRDHGAL